jgi:tetratricopeptide (TPR) repeat protein
MRTFAYGLFLVVLLAGAVVLLRSIPTTPREPAPAPRLTGVVTPDVSAIDPGNLDEADADELYALGVEFFQMWRVREATVVFERAVAVDSTYHPAWRKLVECYADPIIDDEDALDYAIMRAMATAPGDTSLVAGMQALYVERDFAAAVAQFSRASREKDDAEEAHYLLALTYFLLGRPEDASRELAPLVKRDPSVGPRTELYIRRAAAVHEYDRAASMARELGRLYAQEPFPYVLIAQVELSRGNRQAAAEFCNNAMALDPRCVPAIMTRALLYADAGEFDAARVSYEKLLLFDELVLKSIGNEGIGFVEFIAGDFDEGIEAMDEAIRQAMLAGATRRGLTLSLRLVEYLCQLGQPDRAENVVERWLTGFGDIPVRLARARIQLLNGDFEPVGMVLEELGSEMDWVLWARRLSLDATELTALARVSQQRQKDALAVLAAAPAGSAVAAGTDARRTFLTGFAAFESGDAETAAASFARARLRLYGLEFPYHGDPVLYVQSLFFLGEADVARGNRAEALASYEAFIAYWGEAAWDLEGVARARRKIETLGSAAVPPQG